MRTLESQIAWFRRAQGLLTGVILLAVAIFYLGFYRPATTHWRDLQAEIEAKHQNLQASRSKAGELPAVARDVQQLQQRLDRFDRKIPRNQDLPQFLTLLESLKQQAGLRKCALKPDAPRAFDSYSEQSIHIEFEADFPQLAEFLSRVEDMDRMTRVRKLLVKSVDPGSGAVAVQMDVCIYFLES